MHLVSPPEKLARLNAAPLAVIAVVRNEMFMLPHFLAHYRRLGVEAFLVVDNCSDDGSFAWLHAQPDVALFSADTMFRRAAQGTDWKIGLMANLRLDRWSLIADADELLIPTDPPGPDLPAGLAGPAFDGADAARVAMLDMYPAGPLSAATFDSGAPFAEADHVDRAPLRENALFRGPFGDGRTRTSALRHRLFPGSRPELFVSEKVALVRYRPWMRFSLSMHYATGVRLAEAELVFGHFKYTAEFHAKALRELGRGQYFNGSEEYAKYLSLHGAGDAALHDPAVSVPWRRCDLIRGRALAPGWQA
jgi:hypothetical protein